MRGVTKNRVLHSAKNGAKLFGSLLFHVFVSPHVLADSQQRPCMGLSPNGRCSDLYIAEVHALCDARGWQVHISLEREPLLLHDEWSR